VALLCEDGDGDDEACRSRHFHRLPSLLLLTRLGFFDGDTNAAGVAQQGRRQWLLLLHGYANNDVDPAVSVVVFPLAAAIVANNVIKPSLTSGGRRASVILKARCGVLSPPAAVG